jgi:hypothetical protein
MLQLVFSLLVFWEPGPAGHQAAVQHNTAHRKASHCIAAQCSGHPMIHLPKRHHKASQRNAAQNITVQCNAMQWSIDDSLVPSLKLRARRKTAQHSTRQCITTQDRAAHHIARHRKITR